MFGLGFRPAPDVLKRMRIGFHVAVVVAVLHPGAFEDSLIAGVSGLEMSSQHVRSLGFYFGDGSV